MGTTIKLIESLGKLCENPEWRDSLDEIETQTTMPSSHTSGNSGSLISKIETCVHYNLEAESRRANSVLEGYSNLFQKDCEKMALSKVLNWDKFVGVLKKSRE